MKRPSTHNYPLNLGLALSAFFLFLAIFGPRLAPIDPMEVFDDVIFAGDQTYIPSRFPIAPRILDQFLLGTDNAGRDLFSRLLSAVRPTLLLCLIIAGLRIIIGLVLGLLAGWFGGSLERLIDVLTDVCLAVPILLLALAIIAFIGDKELSTFTLALVLTGWASTAVFVKNSTLVIKQAPYIESARAVGVRPFGILRDHVLPQLWPALPALIAFELAATLLVIAELGFLGMFIGEAFVRIGEDPNSAGTVAVGLTASYPELGQMLSDFWNKMIRTPWEVAAVGILIFMQIFAFNLLGEGLRRQMDVTRPRRGWLQRKRYAQIGSISKIEPISTK